MFKVIINNRDRLSTTKKLVEDLLNRNTEEIWIIDNESSYHPLLDWYNNLPNGVSVFKYENHGHLALFSTGILDKIKEDWVFYTDSDIQLNPNMPYNYQQIMYEYAIALNSKKISLALDISDLPDHYMFKQQVLRNEHRWWDKEVLPNVYEAHTDTTFSLNNKVDQYDSYRLADDFTSKHMPWYLDLNNLDEEEQYYIDNCSDHRATQYTKQHKIKTEL